MNDVVSTRNFFAGEKQGGFSVSVRSIEHAGYFFTTDKCWGGESC